MHPLHVSAAGGGCRSTDVYQFLYEQFGLRIGWMYQITKCLTAMGVPVNSILCIPYARYEYSGCTNETATLCWHFSRDLIFVALFQIRHIGSIYPKPLYFDMFA